jgi:hypothetical protein
MDRAFQRLVVRSRPLGNHARKYLRTVEKHGERLLACLDRAGELSRVHTDRSAPSLADDFDCVASAGADEDETLVLLGTFYGIQFLHQNARSLERLALDLTEEPDRLPSYRTFLRRVEDDFFRLVSAYVIRVLRVLVPSPPPGPYLICAVGTRGHQDDIDVAVIDEGGEARPALEHTFARLSGQMLRYASTLDYYLSGSVGVDGYCVSLAELRKALRSERPDFVVVTELLRAEPLTGSRALYRGLRRDVIAEYFHRPGQDNTRHELYLRGILGEIRALLLRPAPSDSVHPKDDGLRLVIGLTSAMKVIEGLRATQSRDLLNQLRRRRPDLARHLAPLEESLVFLDTFRHLSQTLIAEEEEIQVEGEGARENLEGIAAAMGYTDRGPVHATDRLLVNYHEAVEVVHKVAEPLMEQVAHHLAEGSRFSRWTRKRRPEEAPPDLARQFARALRNFKGVRFWDDLLEALSAPDGRLLQAFVESFRKLSEKDRRALARDYADWGIEVPYTFLTIQTLVAQSGGNREGGPGIEINSAFLERLAGRNENIRALARVFRLYPDLVNRFLLTLDDDALDRLAEILQAAIPNPEVAAARDRLLALIEVHEGTSRYVKRVLARVTRRHPATVLALYDNAALQTMAQGRLAAAERHPRAAEQRGLLGDFYDMEFLRVAMGTLRGASRADTCAAFTELTTNYLTALFDVCLRETEREAGRRLTDRALPALYLTGGYSRGRPYDEDYDLVVLTAAEDAESRELAERTVVRMNRQIARRGVIAQFHFGNRLGRFVTGLDELVEWLSGTGEDLFVDRCQLLGSRLIVGSQKVEQELVERILRPQVFERWEEFTESLSHEVHERRARYHDIEQGVIHLKEMPGGIRELDLGLMAAGARLGLRDLTGEGLYERVADLDPDNAESYAVLSEACHFLVELRSVYRVAVAASDVMEKDYMNPTARILGYYGGGGEEPADQLFREIRERAAEAARAVDRLLATASAGRRS